MNTYALDEVRELIVLRTVGVNAPEKESTRSSSGGYGAEDARVVEEMKEC